MILITGGAGFIGSNFVNYVQRVYDDEIIVIDSLSYASDINYIKKDSKTTFVWCDIANEKHVNHIFKTYKPNKVFHFAAESHVDNSIKNYKPFLESNVIGTINLMNAALEVGVEKFHHVSTDEVYGSLEYDDEEIFTETTPYDPRNPYSASKAASDYFVKAWHNTYKLPYLITNCSNNYGPHQHLEKLIPLTIINSMRGKKTYMHSEGRLIRDWLYVEDHCRAIWKLEEDGIMNDTYNIGGGCELDVETVVKKILTILGKSHDLIGVSDARPGVDKRYAMSYTKLYNKTGWKPIMDFDIGLQHTINWYLNR